MIVRPPRPDLLDTYEKDGLPVSHGALWRDYEALAKWALYLESLVAPPQRKPRVLRAAFFGILGGLAIFGALTIGSLLALAVRAVLA